MKRLLSTMAPLALVSTLAGCVAGTPSAGGQSVRAIMASQAIAPQPQRAAGAIDGAAAAAAYANYQGSYVTPTPQSDSPTFGSSK